MSLFHAARPDGHGASCAVAARAWLGALILVGVLGRIACT